MRIALRTLMAGPAGIVQPGDVADLPEAEAVALVRSGHAEALDPMPAETADVPPSGEKAALKSKGKRS